MNIICGNLVGGITGYGKTFILQDENGNELTGVVVDEETVFTATDNDVREGAVYASDGGVSTGTKDIPAYHTTEGFKGIPVGSTFTISGLVDCQYTKLQVLICLYNTSMSDSVATEKVSINGKVYDVGSTDALAEVTVDTETQTINLNITNEGTVPCVMRYFTYREEP